MEYVANAIAALLTFLVFITIPPPIIVAFVFALPMVLAVIAVSLGWR